MEYKLAPSDITYLYESCKHCFFLKVRHGIRQPSIQLPRMFSLIGELQKEYFSGKRTEDFCPSLPPGVVEYGEKWVRSLPIEISGCSSTCYINGRFDIVVTFDNGSYGVIDFKTAQPTTGKTEMYSRQLHAYAQALEHPAPGKLGLQPVTKLGISYFTPEKCDLIDPSRQKLEGSMEWVEVDRNDQQFLGFLGDVVRLLDGSAPEPQNCGNCPHCSSGLACESEGWVREACTGCPCNCCSWCVYRVKVEAPAVGAPMAVASASAVGEGVECPTCGGPMVRRQGSRGEFWGCSRYPACRGSRNI